MKKSVILIITTLSLVAIILIGLIFQRAEVYNVTVYVENIICSNIRIGDEFFNTFYNPLQDRYLVENPSQPNKEIPLAFIDNLTIDVIYEIRPFDATIQTVSFSIDSSNTIATIGETTGRIVFTSPGIATFTVLANDNSNQSAKLKLRVILPDD
ncbi:MAG: hypothetical protein EOM74_00575 [Methanomicrobia archaeon]|nr:hypothetical protein [Methanomicrobia archaeon]